MAWAPDYVTLDEMRGYHRIADSLDDVQLGFAVTTASRIVDHVTSRQFGQGPAAETRVYRNDEISYSQTMNRWRIRVDDIGDPGSVVLTIGGEVVTDVEFDPPNAIENGRVVERLFVRSMSFDNGRPGPASVQTQFGWPSIPTTVTQATLLQAARLIRRREAPFGIAGSPDAGGSELRLLAMADPDVMVALRPYRRDWPRF